MCDLPNSITSASAVSYYCEQKEKEKEENVELMRRASMPLLNETRLLNEKIKIQLTKDEEQIELLKKQIAILEKDNELQNTKIKKVEEGKIQADLDAKKAKVFSWVSFGVSTLIAVASLVIAIIK